MTLAVRGAQGTGAQVGAILRRVQPQLAAIPGATAFAFNLPPIIGLGSTGGFEYQLQDLAGATSPSSPRPCAA